MHFKEALAATLKHEGGYVNDPLDRGGETYRGISRRHHPDWPGWAHVDAMAAEPTPSSSPVWAHIKRAVEDFYRVKFWNPIGGDHIDDRVLACVLFDCAVNVGVSRTVWFLQRALNALSKNGSLSGILAPDRVYGPATARALKAQLGAKGSGALIKMVEGMRTVHYLNLIEHDSTQSRFAYGWLGRIGHQAA